MYIYTLDVQDISNLKRIIMIINVHNSLES